MLTVTIENATDRPIRMVDATVHAYDKLGREIGGWLMGPDTSFSPRGTVEETQALPFLLPRLIDMSPDDAEFVVCTKGLVFHDGEAVSF